jgi:hypothetical protein
MKAWQLNKKIDILSQEIADPIKTEIKLDYGSFSEPERVLLDKIQEYIDKYAPGKPPHDVIVKNSALWVKGLEIFGRRATELFVEVMPATFCCDELEEWYFKVYFYNFLQDWLEMVSKLRDMPKEQHQALLFERKEMSMLDKVFRFPRSGFEPASKKENAKR